MQKSPITLLVFATICGSLQAGELSVSGAEAASLSGHTPAASSAWSMDDSFSFSGSGELDNGLSVKLSYETMDNGNTTADDKWTGQISLSGSFGALSMGGPGDQTSAAIDDVTPTAYEEAWGWNVSVSHSQYNTDFSDENKVQAQVTYRPAKITGLSLGFSTSYADQFLNSGATQTVAAGVGYGFETGIAGMTVGLSAIAGHAGTDHGSTNDVVNQNRWEYTRGDLAIGYAVSDQLSLSVGAASNSSSIDSADDKVSMGFGAAYTMGDMSIKAYMSDKTYNHGVQESDGSTYKISLSFAF